MSPSHHDGPNELEAARRRLEFIAKTEHRKGNVYAPGGVLRLADLDAVLAMARGVALACGLPAGAPDADCAGLFLAAQLVIDEMNSGAGVTKIAWEALEEGVAMIRKLRNDRTPEGAAIWAKVDAAAEGAPQWVKDRLRGPAGAGAPEVKPPFCHHDGPSVEDVNAWLCEWTDEKMAMEEPSPLAQFLYLKIQSHYGVRAGGFSAPAPDSTYSDEVGRCEKCGREMDPIGDDDCPARLCTDCVVAVRGSAPTGPGASP